MNRIEIADLIVERLKLDFDALRKLWLASGPIFHFTVDNLLPVGVAKNIRAAFPNGAEMKIKRSLRELKYIAAQMNEYDRILEEAIYAFQDPRIIDMIGKITGMRKLEPDDQLYAGGISMMARGHFLNPHLDNSHDKDRERYRVLNLLYYVSPDWRLENGGNLELWPDGPKGRQITLESRFNRLAVMITNKQSWHSVSEVRVDVQRCCVSNYYFSIEPPEEGSYFHVTSFRGRPEQKLRDIILLTDSALRMGLRKIFPSGALKTNHFYRKRK